MVLLLLKCLDIEDFGNNPFVWDIDIIQRYCW